MRHSVESGRLRSFWGVFSNPFLLVVHVGNVVTFPLILTFSRREKEQPLFHLLEHFQK